MRAIRTILAFQAPQMSRVLYRQDRELPIAPTVALPPPLSLSCSLGDVLRQRRSVRSFADKPLPLSVLGTLLYATLGELERIPAGGHTVSRRTIPSAGGLQPTRVFAAIFRPGELSPGIYHYDAPRHQLEFVRSLEPHDRDRMLSAILVDTTVRDLGDVPALLVITTRFWRARAKYGPRGYRYANLEAGCAAQNLSLAATSLGLGHILMGGFYDDELHEWLGIDGIDHAALITAVVGGTAAEKSHE